MTEAKKLTPMQTVKARVPSAFLFKNNEGRNIIMDNEGRRIAENVNGTTTPAAAWKAAADFLAYLDAKQEQARQFNEAQKAPPPSTEPPKQAPVITYIAPKIKAKRRAKAKAARQARKVNRRKAS